MPFNLGQVKIVSHYHSFLQTINLDKIRLNLDSVKGQLDNFIPLLNNKTLSLYEPHLQYVMIKIGKLSDQLDTLELKRYKRGIINGLGSVIKSISGNLDYTDALRYDNAIQVLQGNEHKIISEINNRISLNKQWVSQSTNILADLAQNQGKIEKTLNSILVSDATHETDLIKYAHLAQLLIILADNIDNLSEEILGIENLLSFISAHTMHHSMLNISTFKDMISRLNKLYKKDQILEVNFREYFDIIKPGYYYSSNEIVLVYKIPIVYPESYSYYKLSLAPNRDNRILLPSLPYIAIHEQDFMYTEAECPKINLWYICDDKLGHRTKGRPNCIQHLITEQEILPSCQSISVTSSKGAMEQLDDKHYILYFPAPTKTRISCNQEQYRTLQGSYLVTLPRNCLMTTAEFTIKNTDDRIKGNVMKIMDISYKEQNTTQHPTPVFKMHSINLENLHRINKELILQAPAKIDETTDASLYHTTIPIYGILISATALIIGLCTYRRLRTKRLQAIKEKPSPQETYATIPEKRHTNPSEIRVLPSDITASFSKNLK